MVCWTDLVANQPNPLRAPNPNLAPPLKALPKIDPPAFLNKPLTNLEIPDLTKCVTEFTALCNPSIKGLIAFLNGSATFRSNHFSIPLE